MIDVISIESRKARPVAPSESFRPETPTRRRCNLCTASFRCHGPFERFCRKCRERDELLRFSEWLPEQGTDLPQSLSA
jgi:hypothetical protein